jgi:AraC family transcriptional regulator
MYQTRTNQRIFLETFSLQESANTGTSGILLRQVRGELPRFSQIVEKFPSDAPGDNLPSGRLYKSRDGWEGGEARGGLTPWQKRRLHAYIINHLDEPLYVEDLAVEASLSVSHFCRVFKDAFGNTPHAYIICCRIDLAKQLMLTTTERLSHIAILCGLADQAHLTRLFRREVGASPGHWRRRDMLAELSGSDLGDAVGYNCPVETRIRENSLSRPSSWSSGERRRTSNVVR